MAKIFETNDDVVELIERKWGETGLDVVGVNLRIMSMSKSKDVIKVSKASNVTEFLTKKQDIVQVFVYEAALERLPLDVQERVIEMAFTNVAFDTEKGKILLETNPFSQIFAMRKKYGEQILDDLELCSIVMQELLEEEKERKQAEKDAKKAQK